MQTISQATESRYDRYIGIYLAWILRQFSLVSSRMFLAKILSDLALLALFSNIATAIIIADTAPQISFAIYVLSTQFDAWNISLKCSIQTTCSERNDEVARLQKLTIARLPSRQLSILLSIIILYFVLTMLQDSLFGFLFMGILIQAKCATL
jgi:hypothetical protein